MKVFTTRAPINITDIVIGVVFFLAFGVVFFLYSVDLSGLILAALLFVYAKFLRKIEFLPSLMDLSLLVAVGIIISLVTVLMFHKSGYWVAAIGFIILVTLLFDNLELSLIFAIFISFLVMSVCGGNFNIGVSLFAGSLVGAMFSFRVRRRSQVIRAGLLAGVVQFLVAVIMEGKGSPFFLSGFDQELFVVCSLNGLVSAIVVLGSLFIFENLFKVATNISLLELSDFNHPLLRRLILEGPGTYQHSLVVANLGEAAAEAIGANSLLTRVGAYYHDIGKMVKPEYFVENQLAYRDVHKHLKPSMSKLIIMNHVKEGVEMAKKSHLNPRIIDFITQHHGRSLVYYFYHRAKELEPEAEHEEEYRYSGPKPQSKEIAIVSLGDSVEALSRTLEDPNPSRIEEMVREVVRKRFLEGELDESNLTLKELEKITQKFIHVLNALFHTRINYPKDESRNSKSTKAKEDKS